jgi:hypothetical protein
VEQPKKKIIINSFVWIELNLLMLEVLLLEVQVPFLLKVEMMPIKQVQIH